MNDCIVKSFVDSSATATLIKEFVAKLVQLKGYLILHLNQSRQLEIRTYVLFNHLYRESPTTRDQKLFALAIVAIVPPWRYPGTADGIVSIWV